MNQSHKESLLRAVRVQFGQNLNFLAHKEKAAESAAFYVRRVSRR
jgi:hypothetical protein